MNEPNLSDLAIGDKAHKYLEKLNITQLLPIQLSAIPAIRDEQACFVHSPTGSGKTLAFLLPLLEEILRHPEKKTLVLAPTPELLMQTLNIFREIAPSEYRSIALIGTSNADRQKKALKSPWNAIFATPGRFFDFIQSKKINASDFSIFIFDEIDAMVKEKHDLILNQVVPTASKEGNKIITASASISGETEKYFEKYIPDIKHIKVSFRTARTQNYWVFSALNKKDVTLAKIIREQKIKKALIFIKNSSKTTHLFHFLQSQGLAVTSMQALNRKGLRQGALEEFREGKVNFLISTDLLARGIDIEGCDVIHYDMPFDAESFIHRSGRAARGLRDGRNILIATSRELYKIRQFARACSIEIDEIAANRSRGNNKLDKADNGEFNKAEKQSFKDRQKKRRNFKSNGSKKEGGRDNRLDRPGNRI